jgi:hypothetical protein
VPLPDHAPVGFIELNIGQFPAVANLIGASHRVAARRAMRSSAGGQRSLPRNRRQQRTCGQVEGGHD